MEIYFLMAWSIGDTLQALFSLVQKHSLILTLSSVTNNLCIKSCTLGSIRYCGLDHEIWFVSQITPFRSCLERVLMKIFFERRPTLMGQTSFCSYVCWSRAAPGLLRSLEILEDFLGKPSKLNHGKNGFFFSAAVQWWNVLGWRSLVGI